MLKRKQVIKTLENLLETGSDFAEIFEEDTKRRFITLRSNKIEDVNIIYRTGIGLRICKGINKSYGWTNDYKDIDAIALKIKSSFNDQKQSPIIKLDRLKKYSNNVLENNKEYDNSKIKNMLIQINEKARSISSKVFEVEATLVDIIQNVRISNSNGTYKEECRVLNRLYIYIYVKDSDKKESATYSFGTNDGIKNIEALDLNKKIEETVQDAIAKLTATECPGGVMPVIIGNAFGGVIFHEACGHSLEATSTSKCLSPFTNMIGNKISNECVTLIDNGTNDNSYGSEIIDDEGNLTKKNVLIEKGILKSFLVDTINKDILNHDITSSGRRESYKYPPTSRMHNTYLERGNSSFEEMVGSIDYGLYAKSMGGGSVNTTTGEFNFNVSDAYMIRNGQLAERVKGASLIGTGQDILKEVSMVGNDLELSSGMCGSISGSVPVTVGQPTIKVDKILVGGTNV